MTSPLTTEVLPGIRSEFRRNVALVIGIGAYGGGITPLQSAAADATRLANILKQQHGYAVTLLVDAQATRAALAQAFAALPAQCKPDDRVLIYFAGHGQTLDTQEGSAEGYLIPADADRTRTDSWLPYAELMGALEQLSCRHMLLILDCCFAGSVRWAEQGRSQKRDLSVMPKKLFRERYLRFIEAPAWQVLTSSAGDQTASDVGFDQLAGLGEHSPFAQALFTVLEGKRAGLLRDDGVITATDLYSYLRDEIELPSLANGQRQTPQLWPLTKHDRGEFVFLAPGRNPYELPANPSFQPENNPYLGLNAFDELHSSLLFGRAKVTSWLAGYVRRAPLTVVTGPSGCGKTSLVQAGLLPMLRADELQPRTILPLRLNVSPYTALAGLALPQADPATLAMRVGAWAAANPDAQLVLVIDQLEDLYLPDCSKTERVQVLGELAAALKQHPEQLRVIATVRADYLTYFAHGPLAEQWQPDRVLDLAGWNMSDDKDALQDAITGPAGERALFFESDDLVSKIVNAAIRRPGALPLLSLTLGQVYLRYLARRPDDRTIVADDYFGLSEQYDGLTGALLRHADSVYAGLDQEGQLRMQQLLLRMVSLEGDKPTPRKVYFSGMVQGGYRELDFPPEISTQQRAMLDLLAAQRLVVIGSDAAGPYAEPAHEALIQRWPHLQGWLKREQDNILLQRRLYPPAAEWKTRSQAARTLLDRRGATGQLWLKDNPDLDRARVTVRASNSWMNAVEREFVQESVTVQARQQRRRWFGLIATAVVLGVAALVAISQLIYSNLLEQRAVVQKLIFSSQAPPASAPADTKLLLAAEAVTRATNATLVSDTLTLDAVQNLRDLLGPPELVTPLESADDAEFLQPSADGRHVLVLGESTARLWGVDGAPTMELPVEGVVAVDISADGQHMATVDHAGLIQLWDAAGNEQARMQHEVIIQDLAILPGELKVISIAFDNSVQVWGADGSLLSAGEPLDAELDAVQASPDGRYALLLAGFSPAWLWDVAEERAIPLADPASPPDDSELREAVVGAFSPDGQHLAVGWDDGVVEVWSIAGSLESVAETPPVMVLGHTAEIRSVAFSPDSARLVTASSDATARVWSLDGVPQMTLKEHGDDVVSVEFSPDGSTLLTASVDATVRLWGPDGFQRLILRHTAPLDTARFSFDGRTVLAMTSDRRAVRWPAAPQLPGVVRGAATNLHSLAISPDQTTVLTAATEDVARLWDRNGQALGTLSGHDGVVIRAIFSPDGQHILTSATDGAIRLWDRQGRQLQQIAGTFTEREPAVFSPDSQRFLTIDDTVAHLWDLSGRELATLQGHEEPITVVAFSPDGQRLLTGSDDTTVRLWDLSGRELKVLNGHFDVIQGALFSPDGQSIVTFADDRTTCVWDLEGNAKAQIQNKNAVTSAMLSPDGRYLLTLADDNTPLLWDLSQAGEPVPQPLQGHTSKVTSAVFSPDGQHILTASDDRTARQWSLSGKAELIWRGHTAPVRGAIYGPPDATGAPGMIITASADGSLRFLPFAREALLAQVACRTSGAIDGQVLQEVAGDTLTVEPEFDTSAYACPLL